MTSEIHLVLQTRMGSTRHPGKALVDLGGRTLIDRVLTRLEESFEGPKVMAIPDCDRDDILETIGRERGWEVFRGSEEDVLGRFAGAVRRFGMKGVLRICGDNPIIERDAVRAVAAALLKFDAARTHGYPLGCGAEGASAAAILAADAEATEPADREHVMPFIYRAPDRFRFTLVEAPPYSSLPRLTLDTPEDAEKFRRIFAALGDDPRLDDVIAYLEQTP